MWLGNITLPKHRGGGVIKSPILLVWFFAVSCVDAVLTNTFQQSILQITKSNVKPLNENDCVQHYPTSTVTDLLMNLENNPNHRIEKISSPPLSPPVTRDASGDLVYSDSLFYKTMYEIEVWIKYNNNSKVSSI